MEKNEECILLVDDEESLTNALKRELRDWSAVRSIEILTALSAKAGLELLSKYGENTSIVVSDMKMPEMKGSDFLLEVKRQYPHIVSILLTGNSDSPEVTKAVNEGIFSCILKPWDSDYLVAEVQKAWVLGKTLASDGIAIASVDAL